MQYIDYTAEELIGKEFTSGGGRTVYTFDRMQGSQIMVTWLGSDGKPTRGTGYSLHEINRLFRSNCWKLVESFIKEPYQIY